MKELIVIWVLTLGALAGLRWVLPEASAKLIESREFAVAAALPLVTVLSPNYAIFSALIFLIFTLLWVGGEHKIRIYFFAIGLLPPLSLAVKAPPPLNQLVGLSFNILIGIACIGAAVGLARGRSWNRRSFDLLFALLCVVLIFISTRGTSFTHVLRETLQISLVAGMPYYIASRSIAFAKKPLDLLAPLVFTAILIAVVTAFEGSRHWLLYDAMESAISQSTTFNSYLGQRGGFLRASATFVDPTALSMYFGLALVMLVSMRRKFGSPARLLALMSALMVGQLFTFSRIGFLIAFVGLVATMWFERRTWMAALVAASVPAGYAIATFAAQRSEFLRAALGMTDDASGTYEYRSLLIERALEVIKANPLNGIPPSRVREFLPDLIQGQGIVDLVNAPIAIALNSGILGLVLFSLPSLAALIALSRMRRERDDDLRVLAGTLFACLLAIHAGLYTTNYLGRNGLFLYLLIGLSAGVIQRCWRLRDENTSSIRRTKQCLQFSTGPFERSTA